MASPEEQAQHHDGLGTHPHPLDIFGEPHWRNFVNGLDEAGIVELSKFIPHPFGKPSVEVFAQVATSSEQNLLQAYEVIIERITNLSGQADMNIQMICMCQQSPDHPTFAETLPMWIERTHASLDRLRVALEQLDHIIAHLEGLVAHQSTELIEKMRQAHQRATYYLGPNVIPQL